MKTHDVILALMTALAKRIVTEDNNIGTSQSRGTDWEYLSASSQSGYLERACKEAGLDYDTVVAMMRDEIIAESEAT